MNITDELEFNEYIIKLLRQKSTIYDIVKGNVYATYPEEKATFPIIVVDMIKNPTNFGVNKDIFNYEFVIYIDIYTNNRNESIKLLNNVNEVMLYQGFTYSLGSKPIKNSENKYYVSNTYKIGYNNLSKKLERVI